jgi:hypothetical protein
LVKLVVLETLPALLEGVVEAQVVVRMEVLRPIGGQH